MTTPAYYDTKANVWVGDNSALPQYSTKENVWVESPPSQAQPPQPPPPPQPAPPPAVAPPPVAPAPSPANPWQHYMQWMAQRTRLPWGMALGPNSPMATASPQQMSAIIGMQGKAAMNTLPSQGPSPEYQANYEQLTKNAYPKD